MRIMFQTLRGYLRMALIRRSLFLFLLTLCSFLTILELRYGPAQETFTSRKAEAVALQSQIADLELRREMSAQTKALASALTNLRRRFSAKTDRAGLVENMAELAERHSVNIIHGSNSFGRSIGNVKPILQDLTIEGSYPQVRAFLDGIARLNTLTLLRRAEFSGGKDGTKIRVKLKLKTFGAGGGS